MSLEAQKIFSTVPTTDHLGVVGRPREVTKFLKLKVPQIARAVRAKENSIRFDSNMPHLVRQRLLEIGVICERVAVFFNGDVQKTEMWFQLPNPLLGGVSPRDMICFGRYQKLAQILDAAFVGDMP